MTDEKDGTTEESTGDAASDASSLAPAVGAVLLLIVTFLVGADLVGDAATGGSVAHMVLETFAVVLAAAGAVWQWRVWVNARAALERRVQELRRGLTSAQGEAERWRTEARDASAGLGAAIDRQLERWKLSPAESEVTLLLLKGLSLKEIAALRGTSERTVRQQSLAIYRKADLAGRAELAAFFLEDLLGPRSAR